MGDLFAGLPIGQLGLIGALVLLPWTLLAFVVRRIVTGDLVTRQQLLDEQAENAYLRTTLDTQLQVLLKLGMTAERLLGLAETGNHVMTQIQAGLQRRGPEEPR